MASNFKHVDALILEQAELEAANAWHRKGYRAHDEEV